jgi:hypothetical protein
MTAAPWLDGLSSQWFANLLLVSGRTIRNAQFTALGLNEEQTDHSPQERSSILVYSPDEYRSKVKSLEFKAWNAHSPCFVVKI